MPVQYEPRLVVSTATVSGADVVTEEGRNYQVWTKRPASSLGPCPRIIRQLLTVAEFELVN